MEKQYLKIDGDGNCHVYSSKEHLLKDEECYISYCKNLVNKTFELTPYVTSKYKNLADIEAGEYIYIYNTLQKTVNKYTVEWVSDRKEVCGGYHIKLCIEGHTGFEMYTKPDKPEAYCEGREYCILFADYEACCKYAEKDLNDEKKNLEEKIRNIEYTINSLRK